MGKDSGIEWTHHTFNPWWGCTKVSPGCAHCYADTLSKRIGHNIWGDGNPRRFFGDKHWNEPLRWNLAAIKQGNRKRVFCASMADVFEDRLELDEHRKRLFDLIGQTPGLDWLLLTKRPQHVVEICERIGLGHGLDAYGNVWLGTSVENQEQADKRVLALLHVPATLRFLSVEPLLAKVDLSQYLAFAGGDTHLGISNPGIDWVIVGGESGADARPMHPAWARSVRDQCERDGVPFLFKQWGNWGEVFDKPLGQLPLKNKDKLRALREDGSASEFIGGCALMVNMGKRLAGRELDRRTWDEYPRRAADAPF